MYISKQNVKVITALILRRIMHKCYYFALTATLKKASFKNQLEAFVCFYSSITSCYFLCDHTIIFLFNSKRDLFCIHLLTVLSIDTVSFTEKHTKCEALLSFRIWWICYEKFHFHFQDNVKKRNIVAFGPWQKKQHVW